MKKLEMKRREVKLGIAGFRRPNLDINTDVNIGDVATWRNFYANIGRAVCTNV
jgi:hypothetical protein